MWTKLRNSIFLSGLLVSLLVFSSSTAYAQTTNVYNCDINNDGGWIQSIYDSAGWVSDMATNANWDYAMARTTGYFTGTQIALFAVPSGWDFVLDKNGSAPRLTAYTTSSAVNGTGYRILLSENLNYLSRSTITLNSNLSSSGITQLNAIQCLEAVEGIYHESGAGLNTAHYPTANYWTYNKPDNLFPYSNNTTPTSIAFEEPPEEPTAGGGGASIEELTTLRDDSIIKAGGFIIMGMVVLSVARMFRWRE